MTDSAPDITLDQLLTRPADRRRSLAKASLLAGGRVMGASAMNFFRSGEEKQARKKAIYGQQAQFLVSEIGKLKGSVVKIGQMLALYGEHFLPEEVTAALHQLNSQTQPVAWSLIRDTINAELGQRADLLEIDPEPIGTASLAQVHRARIRATGAELVLKVQYPGIAGAIESDLQLFKKLLALTRLVPQTRELDEWLLEIESLLKQEVDYRFEADTLKRFQAYLKDDERYVVPEVYDDFCTAGIIAMSYEEGFPVNDSRLDSLSQENIDYLSSAMVELMLDELFVHGEMQTDPNFGNFLVRQPASPDSRAQLVLLDFGAIRRFDTDLLETARAALNAGQDNDDLAMADALMSLPFFTSLPKEVKQDIVSVFLLACEPFRLHPASGNDSGWTGDRYHWTQSSLHDRIVRLTGPMLASRHLALPPKEFMFISRKFIGIYTMLVVLGAQTPVLPSFRDRLSIA